MTTLGEIIDALTQLPPDMVIEGIECPHSYRGIYACLAFESARNTAGESLAAALEADGATYEGYKGGDFTMDRSTQVYIAFEGYTGRPVLGFGIIQSAGNDLGYG